MRILLVIDHFGRGGAQRQLTNLALALKALGHEVDIFVYYAHAALRHDVDCAGIPVIQAAKSSRFSIAVPRKLAKQLRLGSYDVAMSYLDTPNLYLEIASLLRSRTKIVVSERSQFEPGILTMGKRILENCHRAANFVVVNSNAHRQRLVEEFPWMAPRLRVIYNGVEERFFDGAVPKQSDGCVKFVVVSTVVPIKNALNLARAVAVCVAKGMDISVSWVGRCPDSSVDYLDRVNNAIAHLGLRNRWTWLGEQLDVVSLLTTHHALIHPSIHEGLPNAVCEAMARGLPVLAGDVGDHSLLLEKRSGLLFDPRRAASIANAIGRYLQYTVSERQSIGIAARKTAVEKLSIERFSHEYETLFFSLIGSDD
jgi:glycosyltransferase involved in cell wall biosynthesis